MDVTWHYVTLCDMCHVSPLGLGQCPNRETKHVNIWIHISKFEIYLNVKRINSILQERITKPRILFSYSCHYWKVINWEWQVKKCWEKSVLRGCRLPQRMRDRVRDKVACVMCLSRWSGMSQNMWPGHNPDSPNCQSWLIPKLLFSLSRGELPELFTWCYAAKGAHGIVMRKPILWFIHDSWNMKHTNMLYLFFYISMHFNKNIYKSLNTKLRMSNTFSRYTSLITAYFSPDHK